MSSESRMIRPYLGVDRFQSILDGCRLLVGERVVEGGSRQSLSEHDFQREQFRLKLARNEVDEHENNQRLADGLDELSLSPSDVELVVLAFAPKLRMVDTIYAKQLDEIDHLPQIINVEKRPRALDAPFGGCDIRVYFCMARQQVPGVLQPWRKGTWLGKQEFFLRTGLGGVGFMPVRLTDEHRKEFNLDTNAMRYALVEEGFSVFEQTVPSDAVKVYVDGGFLDKLALVASTPIGKQLQRQLFVVAAWAVIVKAITEVTEDEGLKRSDIDDYSGSLIYGLVTMMAGKGAGSALNRARNDQFRNMIEEPAKFLANLEAKLATKRDVLEIFEEQP